MHLPAPVQKNNDVADIAAAQSPHTPLAALAELAAVGSSRYRNLIVENPAATDALVLDILDSHLAEDDLLLHALRNPAIGLFLFDRLAKRVPAHLGWIVDSLRLRRFGP
ncbi:MAG: hypothetical protein H7146_04460 [Burkholderiaceae bacterium]|nr:hypothetical protein [Microbacteriaceae bacterium]